MRWKFLAALMCAAAVAAVAVSTAVAGAKTECNGFYTNTTFKGGVVVGNGDACTLYNVTVNGGLTVTGGAGGAYLDLGGSTVNGGLSMSGGSYPALLALETSTIHGGFSLTGNVWTPVYFCGNNFDGGVNVNNLETFGFPLAFGEANAGCAGGRITGSASFTNIDSAGTELDGYAVTGGVTFANDSGFNEMEGTTVQGAASCDAISNVQNDSYTTDPPPSPNSYTGPNNGCPA